MKYEWKITGLKRKDTANLNNIIVQTYWKKIGTDENGNVGEFIGATPFDLKTVDPNTFTKYEDLTEEIVLEWIKSVVVDTYEEHVNKQIQKQIEEKLNVVTEVRDVFPWGPSSEASTSPVVTETTSNEP